MKRRKTREIHVGNVSIGGRQPVAVQGMTKTPTWDVKATSDQIRRLEALGCEIIRVAIPDDDAAVALEKIKKQSNIPIIADIHFRTALALKSLKAGADGVRVNPGNMGGGKNFEKVLKAASDCGAAVRIGVNSGSVEKELLKKHGGPTSAALAESAIRWVEFAEETGFRNLKVSVKTGSVVDNIAACEIVAKKTDAPLHLGVTASGSGYASVVRSALGIGALLLKGVGDTIRVSLSGSPEDEIRIAWDILSALEMRSRGPRVFACPTCGRCRGPLLSLLEEVRVGAEGMMDDVSIAVMGCEVNGPGEAAEADFAIVVAEKNALIYEKGKNVGKASFANAPGDLIRRIRKE